MPISVFHDVIYLLAGALGIYAIAVTRGFQDPTPRRDALVGVIWGLTVSLLTSDAVVIPELAVALDMRPGPILLAGYLGGPLGALIAFAIGSVSRNLVGGPDPMIDMGFLAACALIGLAGRRLLPPRSWPEISGLVLTLAVLSQLAIQVALLLTVYGLPASSEDAWAGLVSTSFSIMSIGLAMAATNVAGQQARRLRLVGVLERRLVVAEMAAGIGVYEWQPNADTVHFDAGMRALYGLGGQSGPVVRDEWRTMILAEDLPTVEAAAQETSDPARNSGRFGFRYRRADGQVRHIAASWVKEYGPGGRLEGIVGIHSDVTDIHLSQESQRRAELRIAKVAESVPGLLMRLSVTDAGTIAVEFIGPQAEAIWGHPAEAILADPTLLATSAAEEGRPELLDTLRELARSRAPISSRFRVVTDGQVKWLDLHGAISEEAEGRVHLDCILVDVTVEVEAQRELSMQTALAQKAQKHESIGKLTGGVAHDFNNLLAVIMGNLELLKEQLTDADQVGLIDNGIAAALRGAELTRNMLAFSRRAQLAPRISDLNKIVLETKNWSARALPENIVIETSLLAGLWPVKVDTVSTESALLNLLINARDAMPQGGRLTIETSNLRISDDYVEDWQENLSPGRYVMLAISDTGEGIAPQNLGRIFEPFFSTKAPGRGSGLGLSMVDGFMKQSGGTVRVYSELGVGTTFKLFFPAVIDLPLAPERPARPAPVARGGASILVAEDQMELLSAVVKILERDGHVVTPASSGDLALDIFTENPGFDLLLTDIVMPGKLQGTDLARALRKIRPDLPVVFMTGYAAEATVHGNGLSPTDLRLMKPILRSDLLAAVQQALHPSEMQG